MRLIICVAAVAALAACQKQAEAPAAADNNMAAEATNTAAPVAEFTIMETSWEYIDPKTKQAVTESIDASGNYIENTMDGKHVDHGTAVMKDGKACFTSAMNKDGEMCWTNPNLEVGASGTTTNAKGDTLTLKRVAYAPLTM